MNKPLIGLLVVVVAGGLGGWYYLANRATAPAPAAAPAVAAAPESPAQPPIAHPVPDAAKDATGAAPLPSLGDSDAPIGAALARIAGSAAVKEYLAPENVIRHVVVTIDNLPRQKVAVEKRPINALAGAFHAEGDELHATLDTQNYTKYAPLVAVIRNLDMQQLAQVYFHFYPLFQGAYQDLGSPKAYFNDRLVEVIDVLLATPAQSGPIDLTRPNVMYEFADPALEARPAGQKLLIRMGPDNAAAVKTKLMELRAAVTAAPMKR